MAKKTSDKRKSAARKAQQKPQAGLLKAALPHPAARAEDRHSATPRGAVSAKPVGRIRTFFREVRVEMKKVTWPTRKELLKSTGVVIVAVVIAAVFIGVFDYIWSVVVNAVGLGG
jgi:preprotein translocase subunit SecE